jgi:hypothetical protein
VYVRRLDTSPSHRLHSGASGTTYVNNHRVSRNGRIHGAVKNIDQGTSAAASASTRLAAAASRR